MHSLLSALSMATAATLLTILVTLYVVGLVTCRLWFSPIARFPGPFLPRVTFWYEFYHQRVKGATFHLRIEDMHRKYGPIVRVTPDELHIDRSSYYHEVFVSAKVRKTNLYLRYGEGTGFEDMIKLSETHEGHRIARKPLLPIFSKAGVVKCEMRTLERIDKLVARLRAIAGTGIVVNFTWALSSLTTDVISSVLFDEPSDMVDDPTFNEAWFETLKTGTFNRPLFAHLPGLAKLVTAPLLRFAFQKATNLQTWDTKAQRQMALTRLRPYDEETTRENVTVLDHFVHDRAVLKIYNKHGGFARLAQLIQQAGTWNVTHTLQTTITHLHLKPEKLKRLQQELGSHFAYSTCQYPTWKDLEKLPYLTACVKEGLRLATGFLERTSRISPDEELIFNDWAIPKGTPVSMSSYLLHMDPEVFPNPDAFDPERWLEASDLDDGSMHRYFVPFSLGSRACLGQSLAMMQIYHTLAALLRPGAPCLKLYETGSEDVKSVHGLLFPLPKRSSKGCRVTVS